MEYNYLDNNFTIFESVSKPTVELNLPLGNVDISDWATGVTSDGIPLVGNQEKPNSENTTIIRSTPEPILEELVSTISTNKNYTSRLTKNDLKKNAINIMNGLIQRGFKPHEAAGIAGNLMVESKLDPSSYNGYDLGKSSIGLAQWRGDNATSLMRYAKTQGKYWKDLNVQLDYLVSTVDNDIRSKLSASKNPREASEAWAYYEKFAGYNKKLDSARKLQKSKKWSDKLTMEHINKEHKNRSDYAEEIYNLWKQNSK